MTESQAKLIEATKKFEAIKETYKAATVEVNELCQTVAKESGIGEFFMDDSDGTVFRVAKGKGTYVEYKEYVYQRTRRHAKEKPGISLKEAREAGFEVS